jgi:excinuclease UvrABC helicase subunit UvrB
LGKIIDSDIKFIYKPITQNIIPDVPEDFQPDTKNIKDEYRKNKIIKRELPELQHKADVVGDCNYLSDIFTYEMYQNNDVIVLSSCCGTGKTYSVAKYIAQSNDKAISIINRKSLLTAQIKEFNDKGLQLNNYEDKETYDLNENGIICINSIMKYSRQSDEQFKDFVVYIDEVNSFLETLTHSHILTKDIKTVYETLIRIIKNCKKLIVSDHTITDAAFAMFKNKKSKRTLYVENKYQKFKGVGSQRIKKESSFKDTIQAAMVSNKGFFAGFDSASTATLYYNSIKDFTKLDCILVTDETRVKIPNDMSEWEGKCILEAAHAAPRSAEQAGVCP